MENKDFIDNWNKIVVDKAWYTDMDPLALSAVLQQHQGGTTNTIYDVITYTCMGHRNTTKTHPTQQIPPPVSTNNRLGRTG